MIKKSIVGLVIGISAFSAQANWAVSQSESSINFVSVKKQHIAEAHHFNAFAGTLDKSGQFNLAIDLASVDTGIEIRDQRMKNVLFNVGRFASATIAADVSKLSLDSLAIGESLNAQVAATITISGIEKAQTVNIMVTKSSGSSYQVTSTKPLIIKASDYLLIDGVDKLKSIAKLPSIGYSVPVSFTLTLRQ